LLVKDALGRCPSPTMRLGKKATGASLGGIEYRQTPWPAF
jgi:hypothetical protein